MLQLTDLLSIKMVLRCLEGRAIMPIQDDVDAALCFAHSTCCFRVSNSVLFTTYPPEKILDGRTPFEITPQVAPCIAPPLENIEMK